MVLEKLTINPEQAFITTSRIGWYFWRFMDLKIHLKKNGFSSTKEVCKTSYEANPFNALSTFVFWNNIQRKHIFER